MDPTSLIRNVPVSTKKEYAAIIPRVVAKRGAERSSRLEDFRASMAGLSSEARAHLEHILRRERIHFEFMQVVFGSGYRLKYGREMPADVPVHDHTKDELFAFLLAMRFDVFPPPKVAKDGAKEGASPNEIAEERDPEFLATLAELAQSELDRHYKHEPHHPEYEKLTGIECSSQDLLEMAIDRLARNVQFNHGDVNMDQMTRFLPTFALGDEKRKQKEFLEAVDLCKDMVSATAKKMYFSA